MVLYLKMEQSGILFNIPEIVTEQQNRQNLQSAGEAIAESDADAEA